MALHAGGLERDLSRREHAANKPFLSLFGSDESPVGLARLSYHHFCSTPNKPDVPSGGPVCRLSRRFPCFKQKFLEVTGTAVDGC